MANHAHLKLTWPEAKAVMLALVQMKEDMIDIKKKGYDWNIDAQEAQREIMMATNSAIKKISATTGISENMRSYRPGDENEFLNRKP